MHKFYYANRVLVAYYTGIFTDTNNIVVMLEYKIVEKC